MKRLLATVCMAGMLSMVATQADAGDPFRATSDAGISSSSLEAMGLSGMRTMTRDESSQIRGQGAVVWGKSYAQVRTRHNFAYSKNGYKARGHHKAKGFNISAAASLSGKLGGSNHAPAVNGGGGGYNRGFRLNVVAAGGFSKAKAW